MCRPGAPGKLVAATMFGFARQVVAVELVGRRSPAFAPPHSMPPQDFDRLPDRGEGLLEGGKSPRV
jgi:hypothetical protein